MGTCSKSSRETEMPITIVQNEFSDRETLNFSRLTSLRTMKRILLAAKWRSNTIRVFFPTMVITGNLLSVCPAMRLVTALIQADHGEDCEHTHDHLRRDRLLHPRGGGLSSLLNGERDLHGNPRSSGLRVHFEPC